MTNKEGVVDAGSGNPAQTAQIGAVSDGNASFLRAARSGNIEKILEYLKGSIDINTSNANGLNALHLAAKEGHVIVVTELLKRGANVNAATKKGNTALHIASLAGQEEVVKTLIRNGASVNNQSQNGFTPLYMAAQENHDNVVKFLLANNANQSLATEDGFTPLAVALQQGHDKVVAVLLENDAKGRVRLPALHIAAKKDDCKAAALLLQNDHDPDVTSKSGFTPLHIAAHYGNENIGKLLLEKSADVNYSAKHQITPLHVAAKWGKSNMVSLLVEKGAKIDASTRDGLTPLHCAARSGHDQVVNLLLEKGAPITAKTKNGLAPLHMASQGDHVDGARILLYHKAPVDDVTVDYLTALHVAAHCGHVRVAKLLLDRKADPNARALNGFTPLHIACKKNRIKVVELLLKHGASIEATTESGLTPLHVASFMGCMNIVIYLIQHGANPDVPTVRGETPLHLAARANQSDIIRILLRNGAHVDASAREQQTPLHIAARLGNVDIVGLLLQHGAAVDAPTKDMYTALHIAAKEGQEEVASVLLDHGASLTSTTKKGFTPLHLAAKYGNIKVARLLLQKDAPVDSQGKNGVTPLHVAAHYDHVNVALLLLDKGAYPHATAKNGYTPLHIAAKKNQMDIATTLLEYGAKSNAESKAGFTPLHLASQEGHTDMTTLLIEHHADVNAAAKNGLTPIHLCAQEDRVNVAAILVKNGSDIGPQTKAGYTPLHVACHFGQINMIRFLLQHGADVNATTTHGYTPLHQAAQQGHTLIINLLLEHKASPNTTTSQGQTALSIAQRLGYVSVVETLKIVTETVVTTTTTTVTEEKYKVVVPETMHETFMSDSEDEGGDDIEDTSLYGKPAHATHVYLPYIEGQRLLMTEDTMLGDQSFRYLTADEMKSLGDDSLPIDVTRDERGMDSMLSAPLTAEEDHLTPQHIVQQEATFSSTLAADNIDLTRAPIHAGKLKWKTFLVSFMVDARGGAMRGCRHSGVRVIIPPRKAPMPMRITCRYLRKEKLSHPPPLMEGEACASRILEVGPAGAKFLGPVIIEVPHFAALRGREREITILRSDNGESWREHTLEASDDAVHDVFNESFEGEELTALEDLNTNRITRILTTDFPQYFALITRIRQEVHAIGPEGGMVSSTVVPQVQAIFPEGALTKKIKVGLQAQPITPELVTKMLGNRVAVSPIVTVEPRRRKFHKPITLTIPVPQAATKGMINQYSGDAPTLRLLCSITGGTTKAQWEDVTGSTPLTFVNDCVSFTTTVSARFWLMDCRQVNEATKFATELYREAIHVPFMAKFVVFAKRHDPLEAQLRVFCMTDDKEDKTLESQEHFSEVAKSRDVEVLEAKYQFLEFAGNLVPVTKSGEQLSLTFQAFRENRLPFTIRVKDPHQEPLGRVAFMREPRVGRGEPPQTPICNLNIALPEAQLTPVSELVTLEKKYGFVEETGLANPELIHRADLRLSDIAKELRADWVPLALQLDVPETDINSIRSECPDNVNQQALVMLRHWLQRAGNKATGNSLEKALRKINREDIVNQCMFNVELVTDDVEKAVAKVHLDQSGFDTFKEELGSSRDTSLRRDASLNGTLDERDIMKEAESAAETSSESSDKEGHLKHEAETFQLTAEPVQTQPEVKEVVVIREVVNKAEATLVELSPAKSKSEAQSDSNNHDLSNGLLESSIQDDEKSDQTTAVSSEATAEFEISSTDEKPDGETHTERKDRPSTKVVPAARRKAQKLLLNSLKKSGSREQSRNLKSAEDSYIEKEDKDQSFARKVQRLNSKRVSFDVGYHIMSSPPLSQKKKKPLVRRGSWPPISIPGQRSRKKKQKKYMKAIKNVDILSMRSESTPILKDSYEWLLWNDEPEPFKDIPLAKCDELDEASWSDPSSLQLLVSCKPDVPCLKKTIMYEDTDLILNPFIKSNSLPSKNSCHSIKNLSNNLNGSEIACPDNEFMVQELTRLSMIREKIHHTQRIAHSALPQISTVGEYTLNNNEVSNIFNAGQDYPDLITSDVLGFENYGNFISMSDTINNFHFNDSRLPHVSNQNGGRNNMVNNRKSILKRDSVGSISSNQSKNIIKDAKFIAKSTPKDVGGRNSQSTSKDPAQSMESSNNESQNKSLTRGDSTTFDSSLGSFSGNSDATEVLTPSVISSSDRSNVIQQKADEEEVSTEKEKIKKADEGSEDKSGQSLVGETFLKALTEELQSDKTKGEKEVPASVIGQAFLKTLLEHEKTQLSSKDESVPASVGQQAFLKSLYEQPSQDRSEEKSIPASVVSQAFLKSLIEQQPSETSQKEKRIPASAVGQQFLKTLLEQQSSQASPEEKTIPASVVGQQFLKSLLKEQQPSDEASAEKCIPSSVIGQTFLKSLCQQQPTSSIEEKHVPSSVIGQVFLKSLLEQSTEDSSEEKIIPASVVGQSFLKSLTEHQATESPEEKVIPASAVGQAFLKSILTQQAADSASQGSSIPASVIGQSFLKSLVADQTQKSNEEKIIPSNVVGHTFLKSLAEEQSLDVSEEEKLIPASVVGHAFLKSMMLQQSTDPTSEEQPIPASVIEQTFLKSLLSDQASESTTGEKLIPASVVGQSFLKSLAQQQTTETVPEKTIPASVIGQSFLKSLAEQPISVDPKDKPIPASVIGQAFLKSLASDHVSKSSSDEKLIPAPVVGQTFLKSLSDQQSPEVSEEEKLIPASVIGQAFLKSIVEQQSVGSMPQEKPIPASVIGQTFLKSLASDQPSESAAGEKLIPASVVGHSFLKSLVEELPSESSSAEEKSIPASVIGQSFLKLLAEKQPSDVPEEEKVIPASVLGQSFLKSILEQQPIDPSSEQKPIPASVIEQTFLKTLVTDQSLESKTGEKCIPASVLGQTFLKSLIGQESTESTGADKLTPSSVIAQSFLKSLVESQPSEASKEEKPIPASAVGQVFLKSLLEEKVDTSQEKSVPASVIGQTFLKSLINDQSSEPASEEKLIPASVLQQTFLKSLVEQQPTGVSEEEKLIPASVLGQAFLKSMVEHQSTDSMSKEKCIPASVLGQSFLKSLVDQPSDTSKDTFAHSINIDPESSQTPVKDTSQKSSLEQHPSDSSSGSKTIPASVIGQAFLKTLGEQQPITKGTVVPSNVVGQAFLKTLVSSQETGHTSDEKAIPASVIGQAFLKTLGEESFTAETSKEKQPIPSNVIGQSFLKSLVVQPQESADENLIPFTVLGQCFLKSLLQKSDSLDSSSVSESSNVTKQCSDEVSESKTLKKDLGTPHAEPSVSSGELKSKEDPTAHVPSSEDESKVPKPESDDDLETTGNDIESAEVEDIVWSDTDEGDLHTDRQTKSILIDLNSRIILKSKEMRTPQRNVESDSCITQFHIGNVDFPSTVEETSGNVSSSEEFEISDDETKLISRSVNVNSLDLHSFVNVKTMDNSAGTNKFFTEARDQFGVKIHDPDTVSTSKLSFEEKPFQVDAVNKKKCFFANLHGHRLARFKPKSSATMFNEFVQTITDDNDDDVFEPADSNVLHNVSSQQLKLIDDTELEELTLTTESDGTVSLSQNVKPQLRHRFNRSYRQDGFDDSEINTTYVVEHPNIHTDDEIFSDEASSPVMRKIKKSHRKCKNQSDDESTEEEEFLDDPCVTGKELSAKPRRKMKEWTETDESGGLKQVTQIKTETSIKVVGGKEVPCNDEELLSFVEKRNFFQKLSLTSDNLPTTTKWTQEVSLDDIPMAQGEIVKEQISFEDKLKMFEHDEENYRRKIQKNGKQDQPTVYRYDFTKSGKEKVPIPSDMEKAEAIIKKVNDELTNGELVTSSNSTKQLVTRQSCSLEAAEQEVSTLLAEVGREEQCDDAEEIADSIISSENMDTGVSAVEIDDSDDFGLDERRMSDGAFIESPVSDQEGENIADLGYHEETNFAEDSLSVRECSSSRIDSLEQSEAIVEEVEVKVTERTCHVEEHIFEDNLPEDSSLIGQRATTVSPFTLEELHEEGTVCRDYRRESFREALELEEEDKSELNTDSKKNNSLKELPIQNLDISAVVKSQILNEELGQSIEDSPLEVKHISEEFEKAAVVSTTHEGEVYKHIKTEIFSQELGEDIESGSPEHKDISPVNPSIDVSELFAKEVTDSKTAETEDNMTKDTADEDVPDFQPLSPTENIEHDDLEEYEEAKDEHSLSEQLLALASNMPQPVKCIEDEDFLDDESSPNVPLHAIYDPSMPRRSTACRKGKETAYTRIDKKEIRRFKTTKQVSTIEEHSSIESSDSPQELFHHDFSENHLNEMGVKLSDDQKVSESTDSTFVPDETQSDFKQGEVAEVPLISNTTSKADDLEEGTKTDLPCVPADDKHKSDSESLPGDHEPHLTKTDAQPTYSKLPSPTSDSKSSKDSKKGDFDNESKLPCAELRAPTKKDESFSSSGEMESHYYSAEASDSGKTPRSTPVGSRPTSSEFEVNVLSGPGSEYETCVTSQDGTGDLSGSYSTAATSQETSYSTACSSFSHSSRESAYSVDSESSGHLASVEISSEASETLVPSAQEMELEFATEFEMPVLDEEVTSLKEPYDMEIPESVIRSGVELPFLTNWDMQANQSEPVGETSQWPWQRPELSESFSDYGNVKPVEHDGSTPLVEEITRQSGMFSLPSDSCAEAAYSSQPSSFIQQSFTDDSEKKDSSTDNKQSEMSGLRKAHFAFSSETQSSMHAYGLPQETDGTADSSSACVEEEQLSVSESSATHSEQTWQTSSLDTAVQITSQLPVSSVILDTQTSVSVTDSLSDVQPEVSASSEQVMVAAEHQMPYLQLNGPIEVDYNPEYDAFDVDDSAQPEDAPQLGFQLDELQFELEEENDVPENHAITNGIPENGIESLQGEMHEDEGDNVNVGAENDDVQCDIVTENVSALNGASACVGTLTEAEKPEAQQEQEVQYREFEDNLRSENVTFQDQTSYLPESDQENLRSLASENFEQEPSMSTHEALQEANDQDDQEAVVDIEVCNEPKASSSDSVDKAEVVDTFPEDERYDCLFQKPETSDAKIFDSSDISETNDLLESDAGVYSGFQPDLYTHHEDDMELKESDMFPSPIPEESKQSTPSFDVIPGRKFFSRSGDTSAASSLQEFERLEADIATGRCSQTSAGSLEKPISGKSVESEDLARRMLHRSGEISAASSLQEFERLEAEIAAGRISRASLDSYEKVASGKSVESDHLVRRMNLHSEENSTASSLQEFERLEAEFAAGRISRSSAESVEKPAVSRSGEHDNISMSSLTDFEKLEKEFSEQEQTTEVCEVESVLPEIGEGLKSQISESRIDPLSVDQDHADSDDSEYEKRMTEMEEVIKLAQTNVEKFHEETVEDLSEGMTYEEYTVTHTSDSSQKYTDTDVETVANANDFEARPKKGGKNSDETEIHTDVSAADNGTVGHDDSSNSSKNGKVDCMVSSTDSVDPSSSTATHATYQFETDSVMSSSINSAQASGEECTMVSSTDTLESETKLTYSQGELGSEDNAAIAGGIVSESNFVQVSSYEFPCDIAESLDKPQEMEMFLTNLTHKSIVPDDQMSSEHVSLSLHTSSMSPSDLDHRAGNSPAISCGQCTSSAEMSGLSQQDEDAGDDEVVSHTTTTTTRIVTTVTTDDGVVQEEQEGGDELRRSMEEVLNQFMTEETTQDVSSAKH